MPMVWCATLVVLFAFSQGAFCETLKMRSKEEVRGVVVGLDEENLVLKDGRKVPRQAVEEIIFTGKKTEEGEKIKITPEDRKRARELFEEAARFGKRYPGMDGLILVDHGEYKLRNDGAWVYRYHFAGQVLKEKMKNEWGTVIDWFEEGRSRAKIVKARTYHPDGEIFPLDRTKISIVRPQTGTLFFTSYKLMNYSLPQVEVGSIVEYVTERETYNPFRKDFFFPVWYFQSYQPVKSSVVKISLPKDKNLYFHARNFKGKHKRHKKPKVTSSGLYRTSTWKLTDVPPIIPEPSMNQPGDFAPCLKAAIFKDWDRIFSWLRKMYEERTVANPGLTKFTLDLIKDCETDEDKVAKIYHYLQKRIRYVAVKMGVASGWGGYDANLTWERQYGCCIDKALLFTAMLNVAGIESTPLLVDTNYASDHIWEIPDTSFQHAITMVNLNGRKMVLDSTGYDYRYPYFGDFNHGVGALSIFDGKIDRVPTPAPEDNSSRYTYLVSIKGNGDTFVEYSNKYTGPKEAGLRGYYKRQKEAELKKMFQNWINEISPGGRLIDYKLHNLDEVSKPFYFSLKYELADYPIRAGDLVILKLPGFKQEFEEIALEKRKYDIEYRTSLEKVYRYEISLPENYEVEHLPEKISLKSKYGSFEAHCRVDGRDLVFEAALKRFKRVIPVKDYAGYRGFLRRVSRYTENHLFFKER